ncbi:hypothetical protein CANINC_004459 [Pichia inconspicua]|uniref:SPX domain-containing protein n=1 Tax=Pichia inconspicua TaxID=52247 RepID=A0A4T0WWI8_9ASCO|nr:hypothetical protein CANINC_004459 [[Candida] inconspicua]
MKFGQSLEDHIVPEWRTKYLDYKTAKKKLKKLAKKQSVKGTPVLNSTRNNKSSYSSPNSRYTDTPTPRSLPLVTIEDYENDSDNSNKASMETGPNSSFELPKPFLSISDSRPRSESYNDNMTSHRDSLGSGDSYNRKRKSSIVAFFGNLTRTPTISLGNDDTEMNDMGLNERKEFLKWVDSELEKVESFYREREDACVERFLVLQDQIIQLETQKLISKRKYMRKKRLLLNLTNVEDDGDIEDEFDDDDDEEDDDDIMYDELNRYIEEGRSQGVLTSAQRNIRLLSFWTRRKLRIINKFDMPSLPKFEWLKEGGKTEKQYYEEGYYSDDDCEEETHFHPRDGNNANSAHIRDFQRRKPHKINNVPYFVAKRMIKKAVYELYRSMELLKSYKLMNRIGFRKLIKKYDKATGDTMLNTYMAKIDESYFSKSDVLDNIITKVEELYTRYFENGNRKIAVTKLRTNEVESTYYLADYLSGLFFGISIPLLAYAFYLGIHLAVDHRLADAKYLSQIWGGFFLVIFMSWLFAINCLVWTKYKVNYKFIFEFNQHDALDYKQYMMLPSLMFAIAGLIAWLSFENYWPNTFSGYDFPWIFVGIAACIIFCPFDIFYLNARLWLLSTLTRLLLSGFYPVEFRDFFMGDIFCSLTYSISNVSMFFCLYAKHWNNASQCGSGESRLLGFLQCLPSIWRFLQCFRRYADTGDWFPHLANMCKYSASTLYYMSLSLYRIETVPKYRALLIFWATINSLYSIVWDIVMDWSLFQLDSKYFLLRDEITFKQPEIYYSAIVVDIILRFQWIFYALFPKQIQQSAITSFCVAIAEVVRRFIWIFFRMENEHATNVHLFRASRESPLPYPIYKRKKLVAERNVESAYDDDTSKDLSEQYKIRRRHPDIETGVDLVEPETSHSHNNYKSVDHDHQTKAVSIPSNFETNGQNGMSTGILSTVGRFAQQLSRTMRAAHIKDFQRRKVVKSNSMDDINEGDASGDSDHPTEGADPEAS